MNKYTFVLALAALTLAQASTAATLNLLAPSAHDQVPAALSQPLAVHVSASAATPTLDHQPVQISWALDAGKALDAVTAPLVQQSREFWTDVSESELHAGVAITTTAPGALIRLSPIGGSSAALDPASILIRNGTRSINALEASTSVADTRALRSAGMQAPGGSLALRLAPATGSGELTIAAPNAQGRFLVHVFEPDSTLVLNLAADRDTVLLGNTVVLHAALFDAGAAHALTLASGMVSAPDGYSTELHFVANADGSFDARFTPDAAHSVGPQLWEAHAFTAARLGRLTVLRDARTAFAVSAPTARFSGASEVTHDTGGMHIGIDVQATASSRYQVSGVLYGHDGTGALRPAALGQAALWLPVGAGRIELGFDAAALATAGLSAPFELHDLRLLDQANMAVIERRELALAIDD